MVHIDNVYRFGNADIFGRMCRTNLASNTAFRGFGGPQGMFATETIVKHAAEVFGFDIDEVRPGMNELNTSLFRYARRTSIKKATARPLACTFGSVTLVVAGQSAERSLTTISEKSKWSISTVNINTEREGST